MNYTWSQDNKTIFMLKSTEHEISTALKNWNAEKAKDISDVFILLINVQMPTIVDILAFMSSKQFMLIWFEHE